MISIRQLAGALNGLWLLYKFDARAWDYFDRSQQGFWASFIVAVALAPVQIAHRLLQFSPKAGGLDFVPYAVVQVLSYSLTWTLFPFLMLFIARLLERESRYFAYMVPYNWMQLPLAVPLFTLQLLTDVHLLPPAVLGFLNPVVMVAFIVYGTFVAGIGLQVATGTALGLVVLDYVVGLLADGMIGKI